MTTGKSNTCDGKKWGSIAYNVANAPKCISSCRQRFLQNLVPIDDVQDEDETFIKVCETLSDKTQRHSKDHPFWHLYCCDAQLCGVDNVERLGEDRTSPLHAPVLPMLQSTMICCGGREVYLVVRRWLTRGVANINWIINTCSK